jgi:hypothetical protein
LGRSGVRTVRSSRVCITTSGFQMEQLMERIHFFVIFHTGLLLHGLYGLKKCDNTPMGTLPPGKNEDWLVAVRALHCPGVLVFGAASYCGNHT